MLRLRGVATKYLPTFWVGGDCLKNKLIQSTQQHISAVSQGNQHLMRTEPRYLMFPQKSEFLRSGTMQSADCSWFVSFGQNEFLIRNCNSLTVFVAFFSHELFHFLFVGKERCPIQKFLKPGRSLQ